MKIAVREITGETGSEKNTDEILHIEIDVSKCDLEMSYGEYVRFVAHNEKTYSDILGEYTGSTEGETAGTLDEWD